MTVRVNFASIFDASAAAIVNPVNCTGVMGAGLAAQFRKRYPDYFRHYQRLCQLREIQLGTVHLYPLPPQRPEPPLDCYIFSFPTKYHWREDATLDDIARGLRDLHHKMIHHGLRSVALPKLGCGLGGLNWDAVFSLIETELTGRGNRHQCRYRVVVFDYDDTLV